MNLWDNASGTVTGDGNTFILNTDTSLSAQGASDTANIGALGAQIAISAGTVNFWDAAGGTVTGDGDTLVLNAKDVVTATGANDSITVQGGGDTLSASATHVDLNDGLTTTVNGSNDTLTFHGGENLTVAGLTALLCSNPRPARRRSRVWTQAIIFNSASRPSQTGRNSLAIRRNREPTR